MRKKSREQHIADVARALLKSWGSAPVFVDIHQFCESEQNAAGLATMALGTLADAGLSIVPMLRDNLSAHASREIADFAHLKRRDLGLRVSALTWADLGTVTGDAIFAELVSSTRTVPENIHLVIDLADQVSDPPKMSAVAVRGAMSALPDPQAWRTITLLGTSMPATTAEVGKNNAAEIPRSEWGMWKSLRESTGRKMSYGDYAVQSVDALSTFNPLYMQASAQLRYTVSNAWFVARGSSTRTGGFAQSSELAAQVVAHAEFSGPDFSIGDKWIADRATSSTGSGNATTWRMVTTNHHLAFVLKQLANLRGF